MTIPNAQKTSASAENSDPNWSQVRETLLMLNQAIMAFQFYDRLPQRLTHVANSLSSLGRLISNQSRNIRPD